MDNKNETVQLAESAVQQADAIRFVLQNIELMNMMPTTICPPKC